jgi:hypothetical protein
MKIYLEVGKFCSTFVLIITTMKLWSKHSFMIISLIVIYFSIFVWTSYNNGDKVIYLIRNNSTNEIFEAKFPVFVNPNDMDMRFVKNIYTVDTTRYFSISCDKSDLIVVGHLPYKATLSMFLPLICTPLFGFFIVYLLLSMKI